MTVLFMKILSRSLSAGWIVLVVLLLRGLFPKAPKWFRVVLWGIVGLRLICPFSLESSFSLMPESLGSGAVIEAWKDDYVGQVQIHHDSSKIYDAAVAEGRKPISSGENGFYVVTKADRLEEPSTIETTILPVCGQVWILGMLCLFLYSGWTGMKMHRKVAAAVRYQGCVFQSEQVKSPFVSGICHPKIYVPFDVQEEALDYIIAHEKAHIQRKDHWWKPLGFLLLSVYWFHPLLWLAYVLFCRDLELACDEKVIRHLDQGQKADYSQVLLNCSVPGGRIAAGPLAFGEIRVKERVKAVMNYKKPAWWAMMAAVLTVVIVAVCFLTNPKKGAYDIKIVIPAGSQEEVVYSEEEISPWKNEILLSAGEGLGDTEVSLKPVEAKEENAYDTPVYLTHGMPIKMKAEKGRWFQIGVNVQNPTEEDQVVFVHVENVEVRIADSAAKFLEPYRTDYIGDASKVSAIAQRLPYPKGYSYDSIELQTREEPYELVVFLKKDETAEVTEETFQECADLAFDLIGNLGIFTLKNADTEEVLTAFQQKTDDAVEADQEDKNESVAVTKDDQILADDDSKVQTDWKNLEEVISAAILENEKQNSKEGTIRIESHVMLANEIRNGADRDTAEEETVYLLVLMRTYEMYDSGVIQVVGESCVPTAITFSVSESGEYLLKDYWEPRDGGYYTEDVQGKFPGVSAENALNEQLYLAQLQAESYDKAMACFEIRGSLKDGIETLLETVCSSPKEASSAEERIQEHLQEYKELLSYEEYTLRYCFTEFLKGGQTDLRGKVMEQLCMDIMDSWGIPHHDVLYQTGQDWFDTFLENTKNLAAQYGTEELEKNAPASWILWNLMES